MKKMCVNGTTTQTHTYITKQIQYTRCAFCSILIFERVIGNIDGIMVVVAFAWRDAIGKHEKGRTWEPPFAAPILSHRPSQRRLRLRPTGQRLRQGHKQQEPLWVSPAKTHLIPQPPGLLIIYGADVASSLGPSGPPISLLRWTSLAAG